MLTKTGESKDTLTRYEPIDGNTYPQVVEEGGYEFHRFYCRPFFIVYEKYKNNVKLGHLVFPGGKEIFDFNGMIEYVEKITTGETLCKPVREIQSKK